MDNRLALVYGRRPSRLRRQDLPEVATAITAYSRGYPVTAGFSSDGNLRFMVFESDVFKVAVLWDEWLKIEPYVREGVFSPSLYPVSAGYALLDPRQTLNPATVQSDPLYKRVLDVLTLLFPDSYPTATY